METKDEGVTGVYERGNLVAIIKRDEKAGLARIYTVQSAKIEDIKRLITNTQE